ncbi:MmcQ/YjbR family DNA-binding protein [Paenibacillus hemerocallicola]|uniref:MmcQ/YjbR family DNA-binding protein n=1 Tax=Paenibacillus hemerocallicola TaxID=1172614 RepID=UPI00159ED2BA|nr:MmcQ/YjbR family DNA-binding protein [Paenibacillus hemerocallicola]
MNSERFEAIRRMALSLPGVTESVSYGTPSFKLKDKLLARLHEDGVSLVLKMDLSARDIVMQVNPEVYSITEHYRKYPYVLVKLTEADPNDLREHFQAAWRTVAPKKMFKEFESGSGPTGERP